MTDVSAVPARQRRYALGLYAGIALAALGFALVMAQINSEQHTEIGTKQQLLDTLQQRALKPESAPRAVATGGVFLAPSETVAASRLQQYVLEVLEKAGGTVQSIQAEAGREATTPGLRRLTARVGFEGSIDATQRLLFELEAGTPFVFVDAFSTQPISEPGAQAAGTPAETPRLRSSLVVSSYWSSAATGATRP